MRNDDIACRANLLYLAQGLLNGTIKCCGFISSMGYRHTRECDLCAHLIPDDGVESCPTNVKDDNIFRIFIMIHKISITGVLRYELRRCSVQKEKRDSNYDDRGESKLL